MLERIIDDGKRTYFTTWIEHSIFVALEVVCETEKGIEMHSFEEKNRGVLGSVGFDETKDL
jgi:hypothetical protein